MKHKDLIFVVVAGAVLRVLLSGLEIWYFECFYPRL
jgi:hypothetical protein